MVVEQYDFKTGGTVTQVVHLAASETRTLPNHTLTLHQHYPTPTPTPTLPEPEPYM